MRYHQLTEKERYQIEFLLARGNTRSEIAKELKRHRSTICREIKRNSIRCLALGLHYDAVPAQGFTVARRIEACESRYKVREEVKSYFESKLSLDWSPEQIAGRLNLESKKNVISKSSIYRFIEKDREDFLGNNYFCKLRFFNRKTRMRRRPTYVSKGERRSIRERPVECDSRENIGHLERDLMEGRRGKKAVLVIADRKARKVWLRFVNRKSQVVHKATRSALRNQKIKSLTNDNGHEFLPRDIKKAEDDLKTKIFYSDPHSPWQRGTVENSIGLLRQYLPKRKDMSDVTPSKLKKIEYLLNHRPRKILNFRTPSEIYLQELEKGA